MSNILGLKFKRAHIQIDFTPAVSGSTPGLDCLLEGGHKNRDKQTVMKEIKRFNKKLLEITKRNANCLC